MRKQIIDCFDDVVQKRILKINEKLDSISPDNINYINSSIVESVSIINGKINNLNFTYAGDSMINSVDVFKLNSLIAKAKGRVMRFTAQAILGVESVDGDLIPLGEYLSNLGDSDTEIPVEVPESFSGLRSFIITHPNPEGKDYFFKEGKKKFWYAKEDRYIKFYFKKYYMEEIYILYWK